MSHDNDTQFAWCDNILFSAPLLSRKIKLNDMQDVDADRKKRFKCCNPDCTDELALCVTTHPRYRSNGYFRHKSHGKDNDTPRTRCGSAGDGESPEHLQAKFYLMEKVGLYSFDVGCCVGCNTIVAQSTAAGNVTLEERVNIAGTLYVFDAVLRVPHRRPVVMEVWHKHKTPPHKIDAVKSIDWDFVEFDATLVINRLKLADKIFAPDRHLTGVHALKKMTCGPCLRKEDELYRLQSYQSEVSLCNEQEEWMYHQYVKDAEQIQERLRIKAKHDLAKNVLTKLHSKKHTVVVNGISQDISLLETLLKDNKSKRKTSNKSIKTYNCLACNTPRQRHNFVSVSKDRILHLLKEDVCVFDKVKTVKICKLCVIACPWCKENDCIWGDIMYYGVCKVCQLSPDGKTLQCEETLRGLWS